MREIKFRGFGAGRWRYGCYVHFDSKPDRHSEVYNSDFCDFIVSQSQYGEHHIPVDPETVGQFTGLHDKNGREIYEGDIILCRTKYPYQVQWSRGEFIIKNKELAVASLMSFLPAEILVIGNIYDNPELLEGGPTPQKAQEKEIQIGDIIEVYGEKYIAEEAIEDQDCDCCDLNIYEDCNRNVGHCCSDYRKDDKNLLFKKIGGEK